MTGGGTHSSLFLSLSSRQLQSHRGTSRTRGRGTGFLPCCLFPRAQKSSDSFVVILPIYPIYDTRFSRPDVKTTAAIRPRLNTIRSVFCFFLLCPPFLPFSSLVLSFCGLRARARGVGRRLRDRRRAASSLFAPFRVIV